MQPEMAGHFFIQTRLHVVEEGLHARNGKRDVEVDHHLEKLHFGFRIFADLPEFGTLARQGRDHGIGDEPALERLTDNPIEKPGFLLGIEAFGSAEDAL